MPSTIRIDNIRTYDEGGREVNQSSARSLEILCISFEIQLALPNLLSLCLDQFFNRWKLPFFCQFFKPTEVVRNQVPVHPNPAKFLCLEKDRFYLTTHLFLHLGHCTRTIPLVYARFENSCVERSPQCRTLHVKVSDNLGSTLPGSGCDVVLVTSLFTSSASGAKILIGLFVRLRREVEKRAVVLDNAGENLPLNEPTFVQGRSRSEGSKWL